MVKKYRPPHVELGKRIKSAFRRLAWETYRSKPILRSEEVYEQIRKSIEVNVKESVIKGNLKEYFLGENETHSKFVNPYGLVEYILTRGEKPPTAIAYKEELQIRYGMFFEELLSRARSLCNGIDEDKLKRYISMNPRVRRGAEGRYYFLP